MVDQGRGFIGGYTTDLQAMHDSPLPVIVFGDHTRILKYIDFPFACGADGTQLLRPNTERMPISLFFSITDIESEPSMLKVATAIIKDRII